MTITLKVYKNSPEHSEYMTARFPKDRRHHSCSNETFEYKGHRWKYQVTSFDDNGDYDLLWRPDGKEPELINRWEIEMEIWFKEFESHGRQILIKKAHDADESKIGVQYCWPEKLFAVDFGLWIDYDDDDEQSFNKAEEARNKLFDIIDQEAVDSTVSDLIKKLKLDN